MNRKYYASKMISVVEFCVVPTVLDAFRPNESDVPSSQSGICCPHPADIHCGL